MKASRMIRIIVFCQILATITQVDALSTPTSQTKKAPPNQSENNNIINEQYLSQLSSCKTGTAARAILSQTFELPDQDNVDGSTARPLYDSLTIPQGASSLSTSDSDLAIQTNIRNAKYSVMELIELNGDKDADRASLALFCLFVASSLSAIAAQQSLPGPEIIRFAVVWMLSFSPFFFVGYGISTPSGLQSLLVSLQRNLFPTYRKRMIHHEAGHFLAAHLLGYPIRNYQANAVKNAVEFYPLRDDDVGLTKASLMGFDASSVKKSTAQRIDEEKEQWRREQMEDRPYFSEGGRGDNALVTQSVFRKDKNYTDSDFLKVQTSVISPENDVSLSWPYRGFDHATIDKLSVVSVAGVCSEILAFGNAEGGFADLAQLRQLCANSEPEMSENDVENRIRYSIGFTMGQLRRHLGALDDLVEAMERGSSVEECVLAIERCENVSGGNPLLGTVASYEKTRREKIQNEGVGFVERLLLGGGKNADTVDDGVIEGKGGGDRKKKFALTGDDPLYAALAVACIFFTWASSGGLSLH